MGIVGDRPSNGVRIAVERARTAGRGRGTGGVAGDAGADAPPWRYDGVASTPEADHAIVGTISADGEVTVQVARSDQADPPPELAEQIRLILRAVYRQALGEGSAPPRKIARWRGTPPGGSEPRRGRRAGEQ